ncbi:hypothetical protein [Ulvibacterium marinum]|uniref:hypothetical protein n=1 Tax=Ulvibacterium marinum TaxID=2419782 RepID=UPI0024948EF3|nr:hypothetical protein [Ulvibacterium marinum]
MDIKQIIRFIKKHYWIAMIPVAIFAFISLEEEKKDIDQNKSITYGVVKRSRPIAKQFSKRHYDYDFYVNGQKFSGSSIGWLSDGINQGNYYVVEYSIKNPEHSRMDFEIQYSLVVETNELGKKDTTYIRTSEMKINIPEEYRSRIENLKMDAEIEN